LKVVDLSVFFSDCDSPMWAVLLSLLSGVGAWLLGRRNMANLFEQLQVGANTELSAAENGERAAFRDLLMAEIASMRQSIKEYNAESETVRERLNTAVAQTLVLRATIEIMEKRVASCKERHGPRDQWEPAKPELGPQDMTNRQLCRGAA
jgi:hypothetical protein